MNNTCERCGKRPMVTLSFFNTQEICDPCRDQEGAHPKFKEAHDREVAECRKGNFNFEGIGLPPELEGGAP